jgi:hypothetical protein
MVKAALAAGLLATSADGVLAASTDIVLARIRAPKAIVLFLAAADNSFSSGCLLP